MSKKLKMIVTSVLAMMVSLGMLGGVTAGAHELIEAVSGGAISVVTGGALIDPDNYFTIPEDTQGLNLANVSSKRMMVASATHVHDDRCYDGDQYHDDYVRVTNCCNNPHIIVKTESGQSEPNYFYSSTGFSKIYGYNATKYAAPMVVYCQNCLTTHMVVSWYVSDFAITYSISSYFYNSDFPDVATNYSTPTAEGEGSLSHGDSGLSIGRSTITGIWTADYNPQLQPNFTFTSGNPYVRSIYHTMRGMGGLAFSSIEQLYYYLYQIEGFPRIETLNVKDAYGTGGLVKHPSFNRRVHVHNGTPMIKGGCYTTLAQGATETSWGFFNIQETYKKYSYGCYRCELHDGDVLYYIPFYSNGSNASSVYLGSSFYTTQNGVRVKQCPNCGADDSPSIGGPSFQSTVRYMLERGYGESTPWITIRATNLDGTSNLGRELVMGRFVPSCGIGMVDGKYYNEYGVEVQPTCNHVVVSIEPIYAEQTIYAGGQPNASVLATYLNGSQAVIQADIGSFSNTIETPQQVTLSYTGKVHNASTTGTITTEIALTVKPGLDSITVKPSSTVVYNGSQPTFRVIANYKSGETKELAPGTYTQSAWSSGWGTKSVNFSYSEEGSETVYASVNIEVLPNVVSLEVTPSKLKPLYGEGVTFECKARYENGDIREVTGEKVKGYSSTALGEQLIEYSYTENGITVNATCTVEVLDYPEELNVNLEKNWIYQTQLPIIDDSSVRMASGAIVNSIEVKLEEFDNTKIGEQDITFSYKYNGVEIEQTKRIEVRANLKSITLSTKELTIYKDNEPEFTVVANLNVEGDVTLSKDKYEILNFDKTKYDRDGTEYTVSYTHLGVTKTDTIKIIVLPNVVGIKVETAPQTVEGERIPFSIEIEYEDGTKVTYTEPIDGLSIEGYDLDAVGEQTIVFKYEEGGKIFEVEKTIRVRAIINVSLPISALIVIDPNQNKVISPNIIINNMSKEGVVVSVAGIIGSDSNTVHDVAPNKYSDWNNLGKVASNDIAVGLDYSSEDWLVKNLNEPIYVVDIDTTKAIGCIDKEQDSSLKFVVQHGNSHDRQKEFQYTVMWNIKLIE